jgi:hypothetical protein
MTIIGPANSGPLASQWARDITDVVNSYEELPAWTPSFGAITLGNGTRRGQYQRTGNMVTGWATLTVGSTTVVGANPSLVLPVNSHPDYRKYDDVGTLLLVDVSDSNAHYRGLIQFDDAAGPGVTGRFRYLGVNGATVRGSLLGAAVPFTFAVGDIFSARFSYICDPA